jgi:hypothetical protein
MLINRDHRSWMIGSAVVTAALAVGYAIYISDRPAGADGGSWEGLFFGILGTAFMVLAALLSARKQLRVRRIGSAQTWMRMHIWLGLLAVPCIWFHSGFVFGGALTTIIMWLFYVVIGSGIVGLLLQQAVPSLMTRQVPLETVHAQVDHVLAGLATDAYELVASVSGAIAEATDEQQRLAKEAEQQPGYWKAVPRLKPAAAPSAGSEELKQFYLTQVRPYLRGPRRGPAPDLRPIMLSAAEEWRPRVDKLQAICEEARQLAVQQRLHRLLHNWLFIHAPLSLALFALVAFHIVFALRY